MSNNSQPKATKEQMVTPEQWLEENLRSIENQSREKHRNLKKEILTGLIGVPALGTGLLYLYKNMDYLNSTEFSDIPLSFSVQLGAWLLMGGWLVSNAIRGLMNYENNVEKIRVGKSQAVETIQQYYINQKLARDRFKAAENQREKIDKEELGLNNEYYFKDGIVSEGPNLERHFRYIKEIPPPETEPVNKRLYIKHEFEPGVLERWLAKYSGVDRSEQVVSDKLTPATLQRFLTNSKPPMSDTAFQMMALQERYVNGNEPGGWRRAYQHAIKDRDMYSDETIENLVKQFVLEARKK